MFDSIGPRLTAEGTGAAGGESPHIKRPSWPTNSLRSIWKQAIAAPTTANERSHYRAPPPTMRASDSRARPPSPSSPPLLTRARQSIRSHALGQPNDNNDNFHYVHFVPLHTRTLNPANISHRAGHCAGRRGHCSLSFMFRPLPQLLRTCAP